MVDVNPVQTTAGFDNRVAPPTTPDMFGTMEKMANIRTLMNQNAIFQQTFQAKQRAGQIMATSPDVATGLQRLQQDPLTASFAPELMNSYRQLDLTNTQVQSAQQGMYQSGFHEMLKALPSAYTDMSSFQKAMAARAGTLSPMTQQYLKDSGVMGSLQSALFDDLPADPTARVAEYKKRWNALMLGADFNPEAINAQVGKPTTIDTKYGVQPGVEAPAILGGGFTPAQPVIPYGVAPSVQSGPYGPGNAQRTTILPGMPGGIPVGSDANAFGAAPTVPSLTGQTQSQSTYNVDRAKDIADYQKNLDDRVTNEAVLRRNIGEGIVAAEKAQTGGGAETYMKLGQALQAIGVKNDTVDKWSNGSLASSQVIDKLALQNSMAQLKAQLTGVGGSRLNAQEFVAYLNKNPNLTTDPRAAGVIFNIWNKFYDRDKAEQEAFDHFQAGEPTGDKALDKASKGRDIKSWPALWNQSDYMKDFAPGGLIDVSKMKGAEAPVAAGVTHRYIPGQGIVPVTGTP